MANLTAAQWDDYDRVVSGVVRQGFSNADVRNLRDGITSAAVRRAIAADTDAADRHGRAILYAEAMATIAPACVCGPGHDCRSTGCDDSCPACA